MEKPPSLPEQPKPEPPDNLPEDAANKKPDTAASDSPEDRKYAPLFNEPPVKEGDTKPTAEKSDTQPKRPGKLPEIIPPPPGKQPAPASPPRRVRRRRRDNGGWASALWIGALLCLIIMLVAVVILLVYVPPEYTDRYIPGRRATRTQEAILLLQTESAFTTREAVFSVTQQAAAANAAATGTAVVQASNLQSTQNALNAIGTENAIRQTATGASVAFDATRTAIALQAQSTAAQNTLEAVRFSFTQTAVAGQAQSAAAVSTLNALQAQSAPVTQAPGVVRNPGDTAITAPIATASSSRFNTFFEDSFNDNIDPVWTQLGDWRSVNGQAVSGVCGTSLTVGTTEWQDFLLEVEVDNPAAQFAIQLGYGDTGRLYITFGLNGSIWWLVDGEAGIPDDTQNSVYNATQPNQIQVLSQGAIVTVLVDGIVIAERVLPEETHGPVGVYTCPSNTAVPRFDNFRVIRVP